MPTRRQFLRTSLGASLALRAGRAFGDLALPARRAAMLPSFPDPARGWHGASSAATLPTPLAAQPVTPGPLPVLVEAFPDLPRHFVFEYYPWYAADPFRHWQQWDRVPPVDLASNYVPRLGAYDSRSAAVVERHARWILESGAGAINLSWWGPRSFEDRLVPLVMDVMAAHGLKVTFHLEPYTEDHGARFAEDVLYLLEEYGEKRRFDALLLLRDEGGALGPVFKGFRTILPETVTDCHGEVHRVPDYTSDGEWRRQTDRLRNTLAADFDQVRLLADSLNFGRTAAAGFDGIAVYDPFVEPARYAAAGAGASARGLVFSFGVNPGYDQIERRAVPASSCYSPLPFEPPAPDIDWAEAADRERAADLAAGRIGEALTATVRVQRDFRLSNARRGFFLVYLTSFNEWHEGHMFEPMLDAADLAPAQQAVGYHNPADGAYRLQSLSARLRPLLVPEAEALPA